MPLSLRPTLGLAAGGLASLALLDVADRRRVAADPAAPHLFTHPEVEVLEAVAADGTRLHVEACGPADAPPVVLVHGWTCAVRFWRLQLRDLARDHRVFAYDLRGHGESATPDGGDWTLEAMADDLEAVLEQVVGDRRALLAGHSLGAMTIVSWAARHQEAVTRRAAAAALLNTGLGDLITESLIIPTPGPLGRLQDVAGTALLSAGAPLPERPNPVTHRVVRHVALCRWAGPAAVRLSEELVLSCAPRVRSGCGRELSRLNLAERVEHLTVPTAVLAGADDRLTPPKHARGLAETLPDCIDLVELERTGHMAPLERPDEVNALLRRVASAHLAGAVAA